MARIVVLSDIHLSPTHGFFWENWRLAREFAAPLALNALGVTPRSGTRRAAHGAQGRSVRANHQYDEGRRGGALRMQASIGTIRTPLSAACATCGIRRSPDR